MTKEPIASTEIYDKTLFVYSCRDSPPHGVVYHLEGHPSLPQLVHQRRAGQDCPWGVDSAAADIQEIQEIQEIQVAKEREVAAS